MDKETKLCVPTRTAEAQSIIFFLYRERVDRRRWWQNGKAK